ncbi:4Fe-4S dicluster domain-containing protein [Actinophytocola sp.]|uniref:4Fe-4S dicluster domain-containing protein n=1 Tax=Actinophytocola sp. TaxID=1872138 RepID=UPI002D808E1A|nr:4Fe-4S dicluster domain-containing protein [Actinophytocola sp.]HET9138130.1 4Fe-4S dicluster domain-containing protein [Actinophytocola sp.]
MTWLARDGLDRLVEVLRERGYRVVGPTVRDGAIVLDELSSARELPAGWGVEVGPGHYRLRRRADDAVFAHSAGPQSWKRFLHPSRAKLWSAERDEAGFRVTPEEPEPVRYAFLGVRGCDLAAIGVLDRVLDHGGRYHDRRAGIFIVAVNCTEPGGVCFCASMGCGPGVGAGHDLALTEQAGGFVVEVGSQRGAEVLAAVPTRTASPVEAEAARAAVAAAADRMGRTMPEVDLPDVLTASRESDHWTDVASRCLMCANCTMVCPTCFCTTTEDVTDLTGDHAERWQRWASCFELDYSYIHGGEVRTSGASRYRQWLTHKLGTWHDQFGTSGCVGCGRCIAWCPAGIDITAEMAALVREGGDDDRRDHIASD